MTTYRYIQFAACLLSVFIGLLSAAAPPKKTKTAARKKTAPSRPRYSAPAVSAAQRASALDDVTARLKTTFANFDNASALTPFLSQLGQTGKPIHILQFGDSHTASDDWVNAMRVALQTKYGDGGAGFVHAGRPFRGFRRYGVPGNNSPGWVAEGALASPGDGLQGLSGFSMSTRRRGESVTLTASGREVTVSYLQQPEGGAFDFYIDDNLIHTVETAGELKVGLFQFLPEPGEHRYELRTTSTAPVRLYGWSVDNPQGITFETLGINGAQANILMRWDENLWASEVTRRDPALVILAYGTNEANSPRFTAEEYRADLRAVIARVRNAAPAASILMVGPPDCGRVRPLPHLDEVIAMQRTVAAELGVAFWNWREQMGTGGKTMWVRAGLAQADYIHLTGAGYRLIGQTLVDGIESQRSVLSLIQTGK